MINYYTLLQINFDSNNKAIEDGYQSMSKGSSPAVLEKLTEAKNILLSSKKEYDKQLYIHQCELLNAPPASSEKEIQKCYKKSALIHHPDKGGDPEQFKLLRPALEFVEFYINTYGEFTEDIQELHTEESEEEIGEPEEEGELSILSQENPQYAELLLAIKAHKESLVFSKREYHKEYQKLRNNLFSKKVPFISFMTTKRSVMFSNFAEAFKQKLQEELKTPAVKNFLSPSSALLERINKTLALPLESIPNIVALINTNVELFNFLKKKIAPQYAATVEYFKKHEPNKPQIDITSWTTYLQAYEQIDELTTTLLTHRNRFSVQTLLKDDADLQKKINAENIPTIEELIDQNEELLNYLKGKIETLFN